MTVLDHLLRSLALCAEHNGNDVVAPRAILWPDGERLWESVIGPMRAVHPRLFTLGDYEVDTRTGPAAYLRAQIPAQPPGAKDIPVIYMPGISRAAFRSAADCPNAARHLFALQYEGEFWLQKNGKDWTPAAFLASADGGLGLDVARDAETNRALLASLGKVLEADVASISGRRLEAGDFRSMVADDPVRMLLRWMGQPTLWRQQWDAAEWSSFRAIVRDSYGFDPEKDGELIAAEKLAAGQNGWELVWRRYCDSPNAFPGIDTLLARVTPPDLFAVEESYPSVNDQREHELRQALEGLAKLPFEQARQRLLAMAAKEEQRCNWVWAKLGRAPLAQAVAYLRILVQAATEFGGGHDWPGLAHGYAKKGWEVDVAALHALALARKPADLQAITAALRGVYCPWLEQLAHAAQGLAATYPNRSAATARQLTPTAGTAFLFVDGLRYDLGCLLAQQLGTKGTSVEMSHEWAALPSVTATAKPAWKPMAGNLIGEGQSVAFEPVEVASKKTLTTARFRDLLASLGLDYLKPEETGDPTRCAWTEIGTFDRHGHDEGRKLAWRIEEQVADVVHRIESLIATGWTRIRVLTDHGWLLLPGGLPKLDLPKHLTTSKWGRCATPVAGAQHAYPETPWFWENSQAVVLAPGIHCFVEGLEYSHGGLTLQETLLPVIQIKARAAASTIRASLTSAKWKGLRLSAELLNAKGLAADLRTKAADSNSSVLADEYRNRPVQGDGHLSLLVERDELIGSAVLLVLSDSNGSVVFKHPLNIGEN
jgi:hypothetical protein